MVPQWWHLQMKNGQSFALIDPLKEFEKSPKKYKKRTHLEKKIRIGYVLKSADVGTLFSSRHSESSSQAHTRRHPHTFTNNCAHQCTLVHTNAHPPTLLTPAHTHTQPSIPTHTHTYPRTPKHTRAHPRTPAVVVELIVVVIVDEFELINHM